MDADLSHLKQYTLLWNLQSTEVVSKEISSELATEGRASLKEELQDF